VDGRPPHGTPPAQFAGAADGLEDQLEEALRQNEIYKRQQETGT
jgi:hypothetical protein